MLTPKYMRFFPFRDIGYATVVLVLFAGHCFSQSIPAKKTDPVQAAAPEAKSSPAYAEVLLKKTELQADLESLLVEYTEDYPKIKEIRFMLELIQKESQRLTSVKPSDTSKLTLALGKLIVRKIELETDMWGLQRNYKDEHPDVKRAKRKVDIYKAAIKEILG